MARDAAPLGGMDLNLLVVLRALLREQSVGRAAKRLGQTQPTVSRTLARLRSAFDDPLLVRSGRGMARTRFADGLVQPLERALAALDRLRDSTFDAKTSERTFRLTVPDLIGSLLLPALVERVSKEAPTVHLQVLGTERTAAAALIEDEVDLVVGALDFEQPELYTRMAAASVSDWCVVCGPLHPNWDKEFELSDWTRSAHLQLTPENRPGAQGRLDRLLHDMGLERRVTVTCTYAAGAAAMLERNDMVISLPAPLAHHLANGRRLRVFPHPLGERLAPFSLRLTWHALHQNDLGHRWFRDTVEATLGACLQGAAP